MSEEAWRTGVCLVRIEAQGDGVLITLRTNDDVRQLSTERIDTVADVGTAVRMVREFLTNFARRAQGSVAKQSE